MSWKWVNECTLIKILFDEINQYFNDDNGVIFNMKNICILGNTVHCFKLYNIEFFRENIYFKG